MKILPENQPATLETAVDILRAGGLVIFPTETCYGIGADATNQQAVDTLLRYKKRRQGKPLSIAVTSKEMADEYVQLNQSAEQIYDTLLPGPVTVVSKGRGKVAHGVESEFGTLGVRIADYALVGELVAKLGRPITATSANSSGKKTPYTITDILDTISNKQRDLIDLIVDAGELPHNPPSTVIDTTLSTPVTMRQGAITTFPKTNNHQSVTLTSNSEAETKAIAGKLLLKHWNQIVEDGLIIGIDGPLGAGKTIFAKGVAEFLQITDTIQSPTYTYLEEYPFQRHSIKGTFNHFDVWKVDTAEQLALLNLENVVQPQSVTLIEWWSNIAQFASVTPHLHLVIQDQGEHQREITIKEPNE